MHVTPSNFFSRILRSEALVYKSYFFRTAVLRKLFDIRFSYNHCNFSRVCLLVKVASKTVTRSTVVLMIWIGNTVNHLWNKHKHCSQRKIEAALLFSSSIIHGSAELFARGKTWNGVMVARFVFPFLARATFRETSNKMDVKNCQCYCKKKQTQTNREQFFIEMTSKCSKPCSETSRHSWWLN